MLMFKRYKNIGSNEQPQHTVSQRNDTKRLLNLSYHQIHSLSCLVFCFCLLKVMHVHALLIVIKFVRLKVLVADKLFVIECSKIFLILLTSVS